ncbi:MAG: hypothetical protein LUG83_09035 [Lachnospiraceae bacterium]|nr:hypothetical protein [Lachnospiraceae bacterium]
MKKQEINVYREIQHTSESAIKAIEAVSEKVYDDTFAVQMAGESLQLSKIRNEAVEEMVKAGVDIYHGSYMEDMVMKRNIGYHTLLNTSLSRIAEILINENNTGIVSMEKSLNHNDNIGKKPELLARKLIDTEEKSIANLRHYL